MKSTPTPILHRRTSREECTSHLRIAATSPLIQKFASTRSRILSPRHFHLPSSTCCHILTLTIFKGSMLNPLVNQWCARKIPKGCYCWANGCPIASHLTRAIYQSGEDLGVISRPRRDKAIHPASRVICSWVFPSLSDFYLILTAFTESNSPRHAHRIQYRYLRESYNHCYRCQSLSWLGHVSSRTFCRN